MPPETSIPVIDLGRLRYAAAYEAQLAHVGQVLSSRDAGFPEVGRLLVVEHEAVITVSRRPGARENLLATPDRLRAVGVEVAETDRGGDITYHGPGQVVVYPILDLNRLNLGLHTYMRLLEQCVIEACGQWGVEVGREPGITGVWTRGAGIAGEPGAKIAAMGVRVKRWVSMHGLSFNVDPDLSHFGLIVPCGLTGRAVTSLANELNAQGVAAPPFAVAAGVLVSCLVRQIDEARARADAARGARPTSTLRHTG